VADFLVQGASASQGGEGAAAGTDSPLLRLTGVTKRYGSTQALANANLTVSPAEILGLVGHNGAGKSTLVRVILGITRPDSGSVEIRRNAVTDGYSLRLAHQLGLRIVFQDLALCPSLRVFENVLLARPSLRGRGWQRRAQTLIGAKLDEVFPGSRISPRAQISHLSPAQRQMVEIAQAMLGAPGEVSLLVLDEPTSALSSESAEQLFAHLRRLRSAGVSTIFISHRMKEVLATTDRTVVMRDGRVVAERNSRETSEEKIVGLMGVIGGGPTTAARQHRPAGSPTLEVAGLSTRKLQDVRVTVREGEIVGLAGLDGQGQAELLQEIWRRRGRGGAVRVMAPMAFVTGDRHTAGIFHLWDLQRNMSVGALRDVSWLGAIRPRKERELARQWITRLAIRGSSDSRIGELSGGTQQKVLVARAITTSARIILLDDPFRGVDIATKRETYRLFHDEALKGRSFVWFTTENSELEECDRVYVLHGGRIVAELSGGDIREDQIIAASFRATAGSGEEASPAGPVPGLGGGSTRDGGR
jgi:ribose transport system ATP-binding protein